MAKRRTVNPLTVVEAARMGGLAAASALTPEQRSQRSRLAAQARWRKPRKPDKSQGESAK